jgi:addiction module HigA family antidote
VLEEYGIKQEDLAKALGVSRLSVSQLVNNKRAITPDMALRLERVSGIAAEHWLELQAHYDLWLARHRVGDSLESLSQLPRRRQRVGQN